MKQPDFRQYFFETFGSKPRKVRYRLRQDSNFLHDLVFLNSLIHDARFVRSEVRLRGSKLLLRLDRDCWEQGLTESADGTDLHHSVAVLRMSPVKNVVWSLTHVLHDSTEELWIHDIFRVRKPLAASEGSDSFILDGHKWHATVQMEECEEPLIELEDKSVPALWSEISANPTLLAKFRDGLTNKSLQPTKPRTSRTAWPLNFSRWPARRIGGPR